MSNEGDVHEYESGEDTCNGFGDKSCIIVVTVSKKEINNAGWDFDSVKELMMRECSRARRKVLCEMGIPLREGQ